ncbi:MAG: hypothetical protein R3343_05415 [Nitriliruptorales bacterium]|nr:hypothetical protein [Nitriliruptorales bacterium]
MARATEQASSRFLDDYVGMKVEASDGPAGKVTKDTYETDKEHLVVKPSLLGKKYEVAGDAIIAVEDGVVRLGLTKDELRSQPRFRNRRGSGGGANDRVIPI